MVIKKLFITALLAMFYMSAFPQVEIWLYDGAKVKARKYKVDTAYVFYVKKTKLRALPKQEVFAITTGADTIFVYPDDSVNNVSRADYFSYLKGINDGFKHKAYGALGVNFAVGSASAIILPLYGLSGVFVALPGIVSTFVTGALKVKNVPKNTQDSLYVTGYRQSVKKKRVICAVEGAVAGVAAGTAVLIILSKN